MTNARDIMHMGVECVPAHESLDRAAQMMRDMQVGSLPICGPDDRLMGILTDRDIVIRCIAAGHDPTKTTAGEMAQGRLVWVEESADENEVLGLMETNMIRRMPVLDKQHHLVGMISEADLAQHLTDEKLAHFVHAIYTAPATS